MTLTVERVSKTFGSTHALRDVSFSISDGAIHGLLGGNGSGKSTLVKILAGVYTSDPAGRLALGESSVRTDRMTPDQARSLGMRFVHQNSAVFTQLTVAENIAAGAGYPTSAGAIRWRQLRATTRELLDRFEIAARPDDVLGELRPADQTMIAIARALRDADSASVLVLDEPTASLPEPEVRVLLDALRRCAQRGQTIVYVSHRIDEILEITTAVTVLRDGRHVVTRNSDGLTESQLVEYIVGRPLETVFADHRTERTGETALEVSGLRGGPLVDVGFRLARGEVVGVAGLLGSGRTELLRMIFGAYDRQSGEIRIDGRPAKIRRPRDAMKLGIAYVPENREADAMFLDLSVRENLSSANLGRYWSAFHFLHRRERRDCAQAIDRFNVRTENPQAPVSSLSGGNQQKVALARWLMRSPKLLLLDEPTQGVDIGARADVYSFIRAAVKTGMSVLLVSSDLEELAHASDRVLILREGRIVGQAQGSELSRARLTELVFGVGDQP